MSWMFRWLEHFVARFRSAESAPAGWVEPSNAITRAVLSGTVAPLPLAAIEPQPVPAEVVDLPARAQPATRTAQRTRRRRAGRAA
jgi:hypothetical protein